VELQDERGDLLFDSMLRTFHLFGKLSDPNWGFLHCGIASIFGKDHLLDSFIHNKSLRVEKSFCFDATFFRSFLCGNLLCARAGVSQALLSSGVYRQQRGCPTTTRATSRRTSFSPRPG
jgi:hypothetical protein